jgi:hypothetical protein
MSELIELVPVVAPTAKGWRIAFGVNCALAPVTFVLACIPPFTALSVFDAVCAGAAASFALSMLVDRYNARRPIYQDAVPLSPELPERTMN